MDVKKLKRLPIFVRFFFVQSYKRRDLKYVTIDSSGLKKHIYLNNLSLIQATNVD